LGGLESGLGLFLSSRSLQRPLAGLTASLEAVDEFSPALMGAAGICLGVFSCCDLFPLSLPSPEFEFLVFLFFFEFGDHHEECATFLGLSQAFLSGVVFFFFFLLSTLPDEAVIRPPFFLTDRQS